MVERGGKGRSRRRFLIGAGLAAAGLVAARLAVPRWLRPGPVRDLPPDLDAFARARLDGVRLADVWDAHAHVVGSAASGHGCWVHPDLRSHLHPVLRLQYDAYIASTGIADAAGADEQYVDRLLDLRRRANAPGRIVLFAFDFAVDPDGRENRDASAFHVPDAWALEIARRHRDVEAAVSVHPYREDAAERVRAGAAAGAVAVKWLPAAMAIDPASPRCDRFYDALAELDLPLIAHAGSELAVRSHHPDFGNPLRLRRAIDRGVRVVIAHAASSGSAVDMDAGGEDGPRVPAFDLAVRMLRDPDRRERTFADVSSMTTLNRCGRPLRELLLAADVHDRLLYGSDYPITAIRPMVSTWLLRKRGYLTAEEADAIDRIREANPLLADLVLNRCVAVEDGGGRRRFPAGVFETARVLRRPTAPRS